MPRSDKAINKQIAPCSTNAQHRYSTVPNWESTWVLTKYITRTVACQLVLKPPIKASWKASIILHCSITTKLGGRGLGVAGWDHLIVQGQNIEETRVYSLRDLKLGGVVNQSSPGALKTSRTHVSMWSSRATDTPCLTWGSSGWVARGRWVEQVQVWGREERCKVVSRGTEQVCWGSLNSLDKEAPSEGPEKYWCGSNGWIDRNYESLSSDHPSRKTLDSRPPWIDVVEKAWKRYQNHAGAEKEASRRNLEQEAPTDLCTDQWRSSKGIEVMRAVVQNRAWLMLSRVMQSREQHRHRWIAILGGQNGCICHRVYSSFLRGEGLSLTPTRKHALGNRYLHPIPCCFRRISSSTMRAIWMRMILRLQTLGLKVG